MIRKLLLLIILFAFNALFSETVDLIPVGSLRKVTMNYLDDEWILGLDDGSLWKMKSLSQNRAQTWYEWWYEITPVEWSLGDDFFFNPRAWKSNIEIQIYEVKDTLFYGCHHLFKDNVTGKMAYAEFIPFGTRHIPKLAFASKFFEHPLGNPFKICNNEFIKDLLILDDNSIWGVFPSELKFRSFAQWWNNIRIDQPDPPFVFALNFWKKGDDVQIYFYEEDLEVNAIYDHHNRKKGLYLMENLSRNQLAYIRPLTLMQLIDLYAEYAREQYNHGYSDGYSAGENSCSCDCD